ncbi:40S ribosomal protein S27-2-like protein [Tanacetum coccineum]
MFTQALGQVIPNTSVAKLQRNTNQHRNVKRRQVPRTTVFSHSQTVVVCGNCQTVLCQPTGGRARLTEGCSFRRKGD